MWAVGDAQVTSLGGPVDVLEVGKYMVANS